MGIPDKTLSCRLSPEDWFRLAIIRELYPSTCKNDSDAVRYAIRKIVPELFGDPNLKRTVENEQALDRMILHDAVIPRKTQARTSERKISA